MIIAKDHPTNPYDDIFPKVIQTIKKQCEKEQDDDFLLMVVGLSGCGKSALMLHGFDLYLGEKANIDFVAFDRSSFAVSQKRAKDQPLPRFLCNDEANINARDGNSRYIQDLKDLYYSNRGLNIFHWWNNPSVQTTDKDFVLERIAGLIYIATKSKHRPRVYYYFRKNDILKIFDEVETLRLHILKRYATKYAYYQGWFRDYRGRLYQDYKKKKDARMDEKVEVFFEKYGNSNTMLSMRDVLDTLHISRQSLVDHLASMEADKAIPVGALEVSPSKRRYFKPELVEQIRQRITTKFNTTLERTSLANRHKGAPKIEI